MNYFPVIVDEINTFSTEIYKKFNTNIDTNSLQIIKNFDIQYDITFKYLSTDYSYDEFEIYLREFIESIGNNSKESQNTLHDIITKIYNSVCIGYNTEAYWLLIRVTIPTNCFDIPRWHYDGMFDSKNCGKIETKFVMTLKGNNTLLLKCNEIEFKNFEEKFNETQFLPRQILIDALPMLSDLSRIDTLSNNDAVIFQTISSGVGAIHSEPKLNESRIFMSIVPATIKGLSRFSNRK